ncbi:MAG: SPOR domain-containing protein, partial [Alphaproteobacteria bacterium]
KSYRIQVAAVRSSEAAYGGWQRLQAQHKDLLGKLKLTVQRVDLGPEKGVFYRVQAGPLADKAAANALCTKLSLRRVECLIVRP